MNIISELLLVRDIKNFLLIFILCQILGCNSSTVAFERTKVTINNQKFELVTTFSLLDKKI
jgi:hypothetical protein